MAKTVATLAEAPVADVASVWLLARVSPLVLGESG